MSAKVSKSNSKSKSNVVKSDSNAIPVPDNTKINVKLLKAKQRLPPRKKTDAKANKKTAEKTAQQNEEEPKEDNEPSKNEVREEKKLTKSKKKAAKEKVIQENLEDQRELNKLLKRKAAIDKINEEKRRYSEHLKTKRITLIRPCTTVIDKMLKEEGCGTKTTPALAKTIKSESGLREGQDAKISKGNKMQAAGDDKEAKVKVKNREAMLAQYYNFDEIEAVVKEKKQVVDDLLTKVFQLYKPDEVMLSFNGGKDCTAVLHLLDHFFQRNHCLKHLKIPTLYIVDPNAFTEVNEFVDDCAKIFNIELIKMTGTIPQALNVLCKERPNIKAVFMGSRRTDPDCNDLRVMQATDAGYPPLMRVNPIINWSVRDVWQYMYVFNIPYCILYQRGYTSIGNKKNTKPNPHLSITDRSTGRIIGYRPGHELLDNDALERAGRY